MTIVVSYRQRRSAVDLTWGGTRRMKRRMFVVRF
jgi:hypothetical protein